MATNLTAWEPEILAQIPSVPQSGLLYAMRHGIQRYLEETKIWREYLTAINVLASDGDYALTLPVGLATDNLIASIDRAWFKENGADNTEFKKLDPISIDEKDEKLGTGWRYDTAERPTGYYVTEEDPDNIYLNPIPEVASTGGLLILVFVKTKMTITTVEDWLYNNKMHRKGIADAALAWLFSNKGMVWYDPQKAIFHENEFKSESGNAMLAAKHGRVKKDQSVRMRDWI